MPRTALSPTADENAEEVTDSDSEAGSGEVETELSRDMSLFDITFIEVGR